MRRFWEALKAEWDEALASARTGISLIEAAHVDEFNTRLRAVTRSEEERQSIREGALLLAQLGVRVEDIEPMARQWHTHPDRTYYELTMAARRIQAQAKKFEPDWGRRD